MSCYLRHVKDKKACLMCLLDEASIEVNAGNRKQIDQAIHKIIGKSYKDCSGTWQTIKKEVLPDNERRQEFIKNLKEELV